MSEPRQAATDEQIDQAWVGGAPGLNATITLGSDAHRALIEQVIAHYRQDGRVRAVAVFGSVSTGTWHELSDVDLDVVTRDGVEQDLALSAALPLREAARVERRVELGVVLPLHQQGLGHRL